MTVRIHSNILRGGDDVGRTTLMTSSMGRRARETPIAALMQTDVVWLSPDMLVDDARESMMRADARVAVVVTARRRPIGVVHLSQLGPGGPDPLPLPDVALIALGIDGSRCLMGAGFHEDRDPRGRLVGDVMTPQVVHMPERTSVARAVAMMSLHITVDVVATDPNGRARGLLSASDVQRWIATELAALGEPPPAPSPGARSTRPEFRSPSAHAPSVLVVEDDVVIATQLVEILEDEGYRVLRASDGRAALRLLCDLEEKPGLILLDLVMPNMDGWAFRRAQLRDTDLSPIPTVVMTAFSHAADTPDLGSVSVLTKPLRLERLLNTVAQHCRPGQSWN